MSQQGQGQGQTGGRFNIQNAVPTTWQLKTLRARHHIIVRLAATGQLTHDQIASAVGCTPQTVSNTLRSRIAQDKMAHLQGEADASIIDILNEYKELSPVALEVLEEVLVDANTTKMLRTKVAFGILDRAGYGPTQKHEITRVIGDAEIAEAKKRAMEAGILVDVEILETKPDPSTDGTGGENNGEL